MKTDDHAWRVVEKDLDLYKFYLEILLKAAAFVVGITGAMTSYYFAHQTEHLIVYSLLLPFVINGGVFLICTFSVHFAETMRRTHYQLCKDAGVSPAYEMAPLPNFLRLCSVMFGMITVGIAIFFVSQLLR